MNGLEMQAYEIVESGCRNILESGIIFSAKTIAKFLIAITKNRFLAQKLQECNEFANYATEFRKAENYLPSGNIFNLPSNPKKVVCLVTGILYEFDTQSLAINKFLKDFFPAETISDSFNMFCSSILAKYVVAFRDVIEAKYFDQEEKDEEERKIVSDDEDYKDIDEIVKEQVIPSLTDIIIAIQEDSTINEELKGDILFVVSGLSYAIDTFNSKIVTTIWIAFRNMVSDIKSIQTYIKVIDNILNQYGVIDIKN